MSMDAKGIIGGGKKENRKAGDLYPTPAEVTVALLDFLKPYLSDGGGDLGARLRRRRYGKGHARLWI